MELRPLGRTGVRVSALCLGTMTFGREADEAASRAIVHRFLDAGGNFVDTADVYAGGASEEITGRALAGRRDGVVLATKGRMPTSRDPNNRGAGRRHLTRALDASLRRLGTDRIDLYQVHWPDPATPIEETLAALDGFVRAGKVLHYGLSNYTGWELQRAIDACAHRGWAPLASHQPQYSLLSREIELETLPLCAEHGIAVIPWSPLGGGFLSGKYRSADDVPTDTRLGASGQQAARRITERNLAIADAVRAVAAEVGRTPAQVAINWVLHRPGITAPILGARTITQLEDNLGAEGWRLDAEHVQALDRASRAPLPYPHDMYEFIYSM